MARRRARITVTNRDRAPTPRPNKHVEEGEATPRDALLVVAGVGGALLLVGWLLRRPAPPRD